MSGSAFRGACFSIQLILRFYSAVHQHPFTSEALQDRLRQVFLDFGSTQDCLPPCFPFLMTTCIHSCVCVISIFAQHQLCVKLGKF